MTPAAPRKPAKAPTTRSSSPARAASPLSSARSISVRASARQSPAIKLERLDPFQPPARPGPASAAPGWPARSPGRPWSAARSPPAGPAPATAAAARPAGRRRNGRMPEAAAARAGRPCGPPPRPGRPAPAWALRRLSSAISAPLAWEVRIERTDRDPGPTRDGVGVESGRTDRLQNASRRLDDRLDRRLGAPLARGFPGLQPLAGRHRNASCWFMSICSPIFARDPISIKPRRCPM